MMKQNASYLCFALLLAASAGAQGISARVVAETALRVQAKSVIKTLPAKTDLSQGVTLKAKADNSHYAQLVTSFSHSPTQTVFHLTETGYGSGSFFPVVKTGKHTILITLQAPVSVQGNLRVQMTWFKTTFSHRAGGQDQVLVGSHKFQIFPPLATKVDQTIPVTVGPQALEIRSVSQQWASNNILSGSFHYECKLTFTPKMPCTLTTYGKSCGSTLQGTAYPTREIQLDLAGGFPRAAGLLALGFERQTFQIPKTPCILLTKIAFLGSFLTDSQGKTSWLIPLPPGLTLTFQIQAATFARSGSKLLLRMTNGVEAACKP